MKKFDFNKWLQNPTRRIVTRKGDKVEILGYDETNGSFPVIARLPDGPACYTNDGLLLTNMKCDEDLMFADEEEPELSGLKWRRCKAGFKFPSDAIVIPDDDRTTDSDPRLVRCAVWNSWFILVENLKKIPFEE